MSAQQILLVDDNKILLEIVSRSLQKEGYKTWTAVSGKEALRCIQKNGLPHLAIVDINMPGMNGFELGRRIHRFADLPIILLSSEDEEEIVVRGLKQFAEDYIIKPTEGPLRLKELATRIERVLRRIGDFAYTLDPVITVDDRLQVDLGRPPRYSGRRAISLTPTESKLLYILMRYAGRTVSTSFLLRRMWPLEDVFEDRLHTIVYRLRRKSNGTRATLSTSSPTGATATPSPCIPKLRKWPPIITKIYYTPAAQTSFQSREKISVVLLFSVWCSVFRKRQNPTGCSLRPRPF
jgi:DNA-binding response OmpR family regulator